MTTLKARLQRLEAAGRAKPQADRVDPEFERAFYALSEIRSGIGYSREPSEVMAAECPAGIDPEQFRQAQEIVCKLLREV